VEVSELASLKLDEQNDEEQLTEEQQKMFEDF
jgi:hypothetical protein